MGAGVADGIDDSGGDLSGEEIEEDGREVGERSGEPVIDFGGGKVGGSVMGVGRSEHEFLGAQALLAIDGFEHFGVQAGGNGEQLRGDQREMVAAAVIEVERTRV